MNLGRTDHFDEEGAGADRFGAVHLSQELVDLPADTEWGDRGEGPAILQAQQDEAGAVRDVGRVVIGRGVRVTVLTRVARSGARGRVGVHRTSRSLRSHGRGVIKCCQMYQIVDT